MLLVRRRPEVEIFLDWFFHAASFSEASGSVISIEWPREGGLRMQFAKLVDAVDLVKNELRFLDREQTTTEPPRADERRRGA